MTTLSVKINKKSRIPLFRRIFQGRTEKLLQAASKRGSEIAKESIRNSPASSRVYFSPRTRRLQEASFPGNPPRIDSGSLHDKIKDRRIDSSKYVIESLASFSAALEFGRGTNLRGQPLEARPYMLPMAVQLKKEYPKLIKNIISETEIRKQIR